MGSVVLVLQPWLPFPALQSPLCKWLDARAPVDCIVQPDDVCNVTALLDWSLTPSKMSISPDEGQFGPKVQKAGQTPQVLSGMWARSAMKRPLVYALFEERRTEARPPAGFTVV